MTERLIELSAALGEALAKQGCLMATAESCTGGLVAAAVTEVAGSSEWFERAFITYSNRAKIEMLGVSASTLAQHGAVSEATVREMAAGAVARSGADIAVAISGVAGPSGGSADKPVGTVWFAWASGSGVDVQCECFAGDRAAVRQRAAQVALEGLLLRCEGGYS